jgi:uncharacterized protein YcfJ
MAIEGGDRLMKKTIVLIAALGAAGLCAAQEMGRVISSTPLVQQMGVPRQVCSLVPVAVQTPNTGAGAAMGAIAGGAIGNAIGDGGGRAVATMIGLVGGAIVGDRVEGSPQPQAQQMQQCTTQIVTESRTVGYNVLYEYAGRQYQVQMPNDPGPTVALQVTPVGATVPAPAQMAINPAQPLYVPPPGYGVAPAPAFVTGYYGQPYVQPYVIPYARPYYPPVGVSLNFGYSRGYYGHRHWR